MLNNSKNVKLTTYKNEQNLRSRIGFIYEHKAKAIFFLKMRAITGNLRQWNFL
jgi:hypothetical protein